MPAKPVPVCPCCQNYAKIQISITDMCEYVRAESYSALDSTLLHEPCTKEMLLHDPYTPESAESHSPLPEEKKDKKSVSPRILKSRLENILRKEDHKKLAYSVSDSRVTQKIKPYLSKSHSQHLNYLEEPVMYRQRCMTEISRKVSKAKLISSAHSVQRLQSHHSSSDEDWFEFEDVELKDDIFEDTIETEVVSEEVCEDKTEKKNMKNKKRQKIDACCCLS